MIVNDGVAFMILVFSLALRFPNPNPGSCVGRSGGRRITVPSTPRFGGSSVFSPSQSFGAPVVPPTPGTFSGRGFSRGRISCKSSNMFCVVMHFDFVATRGGTDQRSFDNADTENRTQFGNFSRPTFGSTSGGNSVPLGVRTLTNSNGNRSDAAPFGLSNLKINDDQNRNKENSSGGNYQPRQETDHLKSGPEDKEIFGEEIEAKFDGTELPRKRAPLNFVPTARSADELFEEDQKYADKYANLINNDDKLIVEGLNGVELSKVE